MGEAHTTLPTPINSDLLCPHCGYNLRTQPANSRCPECGTAVAAAIAAAKAGPVDYRALARGAAFLCAAAITPVALPLGYAAAIRRLDLGPAWTAAKMELLLAVLLPGFLLTGILFLVRARRYPFARRRAARLVIAQAILVAVLVAMELESDWIVRGFRALGMTLEQLQWVWSAEAVAMTILASALVYWGMAQVVRACPPAHRTWVTVCAFASGSPLVLFMIVPVIESVRRAMGYGWWETGWHIREWLSAYVRVGTTYVNLIPVWDRIPLAVFCLGVWIAARRHSPRQTPDASHP